MDTINRRKFIELTGAGTKARAAESLSFAEIAKQGELSPIEARSGILVIVTLYGGNDGLSTLIPYRNPDYFTLRPTLSFQEDEVLPLDDSLALNASMVGFKALWDDGLLGIVRGVGYPRTEHSHFSSMAIWQSAVLNAVNSGWIGRWLDTKPRDKYLAINLGSILPPMLAGNQATGSVLPLTEARAKMKSSRLAEQLKIVAQLIAAGAPTKVWSVSLGGFDTHSDAKETQSTLLGVVSDAITAFMAELKFIGRSKHVTVLVYSEFGRRVRANETDGTDHGTSSPVFLIGERVKGGFHGEDPELDVRSKEDLPVTTDFRDIYAEVLEQILDSESERVIERSRSVLGLFR